MITYKIWSRNAQNEDSFDREIATALLHHTACSKSELFYDSSEKLKIKKVIVIYYFSILCPQAKKILPNFYSRERYDEGRFWSFYSRRWLGDNFPRFSCHGRGNWQSPTYIRKCDDQLISHSDLYFFHFL